MAYIDSQLEFSDAQAVLATAISTNVYDILTMRKGGSAAAGDISPNARLDLGNDDTAPWLIVTVNTAYVGGTSLTATLETADDAALTTNATVLASSGAVPLANLTAGAQLLAIKLPSALYRRYIGLRYTIVGTMTAGVVDGYITLAPQQNRIYKSGFTVQ